jgi:hypothetical protein
MVDPDRPTSASQMLRLAAEWLDVADEAFALIYRARDKTCDAGNEVQTDMRLLADLIDSRPDVAAWLASELSRNDTQEARQ